MAACAPALSQTLTVRGRRAVEPAAGSCARTRPGGNLRIAAAASSTLTVSPSSVTTRRGLVRGPVVEVGNLDLARPQGEAHRGRREHDVGGDERADQQQKFASAPDARCEGHRARKWS